MEEAKVIQDKGDQINFFPCSSLEKQTSKQTHVSNPEPDLNLRLSLGDIYNTKQNPLTRSSSIAGEVVNSKRNFIEHLENTLPKSYLSLARSSSLPVEMERGKRVVNMKELRVMKRVEAKKRAEEKHRNMPVPCFPTELPAWAVASAANSPALNRAIGKIKEIIRASEGLGGSENPNPRPEIASEATTDAVVPEFENPIKKAKLSNGWIQDDGMAIIKKMPTVTVTGDGPNGRTIEGFLYQYTNQQVTIVCVCHGHFLSPEEFVKHAGCKDVTNPMKQICVCPTSFFY